MVEGRRTEREGVEAKQKHYRDEELSRQGEKKERAELSRHREKIEEKQSRSNIEAAEIAEYNRG